MHDTLSAPRLRARFKATSRLGLASAITAIVACIDAVWLLLAGWSVSGRGLAVFTLGVAACVHTSDNSPTVRAGNDSTDNPRARDGGRAAGAGGSHAPGSTGLGAGTMGIENNARAGSGR